jgi:phage-related protein
MIHLYVRQNNRGAWWCNGTINGYDHSFEGTLESCQIQMASFLTKKGIAVKDVVWHEPRLYPKVLVVPQPPVTYMRWRIDKGMV